MPFRPPGILIAGALLCCIASRSWSGEIWVITDTAHPVSAVPNARIIELDANNSIRAELATQLPSDPHEAATIVRGRLQARGDALRTRLAAAHQGVVDSRNLGIAKIPAVIVDRRYVVYGESNVSRALALIEHYRSTHS